jgi:glutathione S-transferase
MCTRHPRAPQGIEVWGRLRDHAEALRHTKALPAVMEAHLGTRRRRAGDGPTPTDVACYSYTAVADEGGVGLGELPKVRSSLDAAESLEGFVSMPKQLAE